MPRLPSSLKWLIDRRGRVDGEIKKIEASLAKCQRIADELVQLHEILKSIDQTLALHEIQVKPEYIPTIRSQNIRIGLPHGELTRGILLCLRLNEPLTVRTEEIACFIAAKYSDLTAESIAFKDLRQSVRYRLKCLCREGVVRRYHSSGDRREGLWGLPDDQAAND